ncbi:hypothetical protein NDU88_001459 [Pleurodeles waltl]|uniref:Uncharacterized protein n=1 Tax=Pleurodeles waltl TaxID=8319 RepID=A0AAV7SZZ2_PLEWA|nr:hypothetical protein NDU88_001459 [Pleurodeles waltl]
MELCEGFRVIDTWFDTLTSHIDRMGEHLDCQNVCLDGAEERISTLKDDSNSVKRRPEKVEAVLKYVSTNNEVTPLPRGFKHTDTSRMDLFV